MNGWVIFAGLCIAFLVGVILERAWLKEDYDCKLNHLHTCYMDEIHRNAALTRQAEIEEVDVAIDKLLKSIPDESTVTTCAPGQDPRD